MLKVECSRETKMTNKQANECKDKITALGYHAEVVKHNNGYFVEVWK